MNAQEQARRYAEETGRGGAFRCELCGRETNDRRLMEERHPLLGGGLRCRGWQPCRKRQEEARPEA